MSENNLVSQVFHSVEPIRAKSEPIGESNIAKLSLPKSKSKQSLSERFNHFNKDRKELDVIPISKGLPKEGVKCETKAPEAMSKERIKCETRRPEPTVASIAGKSDARQVDDVLAADLKRRKLMQTLGKGFQTARDRNQRLSERKIFRKSGHRIGKGHGRPHQSYNTRVAGKRHGKHSAVTDRLELDVDLDMYMTGIDVNKALNKPETK